MKRNRAALNQPKETVRSSTAVGDWVDSSSSAATAAEMSRGWLAVWIVILVVVAGVLVLRFKPYPARETPGASPRTTAQNQVRTDGGGASSPARKASDDALVEGINRANQLLAKGKPADALELLQQAAKLSPGDEDVHYNLGIALSRLDRNEEAIAEYQAALRIFPDYAEVHNNLGNLLGRIGREDEAIHHFEQAIKITPDYAAAWNNLGSVLQKSGHTNEAQEKFRQAVQSDTNYWQAHFNLGRSYADRQKFADAQVEFETVLRLEPGFTPAKVALGRIEHAPEAGPLRPSDAP